MRFFGLRAPSLRSGLAVLALDTCLAMVAILTAFWVAFGDQFATTFQHRPSFLLFIVLCYGGFAALSYVSLGQHKQTLRYSSVKELLVLIQSTTLTVFLFTLFVFIAWRAEDVPRSSVILTWLLQVAFLCTPRLMMRLTFRSAVRDYASEHAFNQKLPILLIGIGEQAQRFLRGLKRDSAPVYEVFGIVSPEKTIPVERHAAGNVPQAPMLGTLDQFPQILKQVRRDGLNIRHIVLSDAALTPDSIRTVLPTSSEHGVMLLRTRGKTELLGKQDLHTDSEVTPLTLQDVLPRVSRIDRASIDASIFAGKRVLITGAGGSIGAELCRQIATFSPALIGLMEKSEFNLFSIDEELERDFPHIGRETILCNVRDATAVDRWFKSFKPDIVFHAAALKHVPMVEAHPLEAILTNVEGTRIIADACAECGVASMVMVSSDKAVNPTSVLGATKRLAEAYCQARDLQDVQGGPRYTVVRFGNVLWSTGSVVTRFRRQLSEGLPLTVTHPDVVRYFMTIDEAVMVVLLACSESKKHPEQRGTITVLKMGEPVRILDLARIMTMLAGKRPDHDVPIQYIGLRQGERLSEELIHQTESLLPTAHDGILLVSPRTINIQILRRNIESLVTAARNGDTAGALHALKSCVPEYVPAPKEDGYGVRSSEARA